MKYRGIVVREETPLVVERPLWWRGADTYECETQEEAERLIDSFFDATYPREEVEESVFDDRFTLITWVTGHERAERGEGATARAKVKAKDGRQIPYLTMLREVKEKDGSYSYHEKAVHYYSDYETANGFIKRAILYRVREVLDRVKEI